MNRLTKKKPEKKVQAPPSLLSLLRDADKRRPITESERQLTRLPNEGTLFDTHGHDEFIYRAQAQRVRFQQMCGTPAKHAPTAAMPTVNLPALVEKLTTFSDSTITTCAACQAPITHIYSLQQTRGSDEDLQTTSHCPKCGTKTILDCH